MGLRYWLDDPQEKGQLLRSDSTTHLKDCGKNTTEKLQEHEVFNVAQLKSQIDASMHAILDINFDKMCSFR